MIFLVHLDDLFRDSELTAHFIAHLAIFHGLHHIYLFLRPSFAASQQHFESNSLDRSRSIISVNMSWSFKVLDAEMGEQAIGAAFSPAPQNAPANVNSSFAEQIALIPHVDGIQHPDAAVSSENCTALVPYHYLTGCTDVVTNPADKSHETSLIIKPTDGNTLLPVHDPAHGKISSGLFETPRLIA